MKRYRVIPAALIVVALACAERRRSQRPDRRAIVGKYLGSLPQLLLARPAAGDAEPDFGGLTNAAVWTAA